MSPLVLVATAAVHARAPTCPELYVPQFERFLEEVDAEFRNQQYDHAKILLDAGYPRIPCIVQVVPTKDLAQFAIRRAYAYALDLDENETQRWASLARALEPSIAWPDYVPAEHAVRKVLDEVEPAVAVTPEGQGLLVPERGGIFLDGRFVTTPTAEPELPHLLQIGDAMGRLTYSDWQDGTMYPKQFVGPPLTEIPDVPRWFTHPNARIRPPREPHPWTQSRQNRLESASGFALAGGALFGTAWIARLAYDQRATDGLFYIVDGATVASGAAGGTAVVLLGAALFGK
jgi:hypothetical protein